jgi:hypothetical protein
VDREVKRAGVSRQLWDGGMLSDEVWMMLRYLRIAFSVTCGIACVLLIVLWVRSYFDGDVIQWSVTRWCGLQFTSTQGQLDVRRCSLDGAGHHGGMDFADWLWSTGPVGSFGETPTILGFNLRHLSYYIAFPYCAPVAICVVLAAAPFLVRNSRLRFSLRAMLIITTLVAVVLGMMAWLDHSWIGK